MNTNINSGGGGSSNSGIAFIVGGLVVAVAVIGFAMAGGMWPFDRGGGDVTVKIEQPAAPAEQPAAPAVNPAPAGEGSGTQSSGSSDSNYSSTTAN